ncbi:uncharacterized protein RSE6_12243 [Rhynchosporium secalis]|uniref:Uncharacterized protein n=1 Tax=Rhynchosporium secalis TaxID=38038 RepID=A0A1E1MPZ2_RHYSE|nr:uncharacterized protein RSE6_12243 [Rhynchosporium secalis]
MCWETNILHACGCTEATEIRLCEHAVFPWLHNVAHPIGLPMNPTIRVESTPGYCNNCIKEKGMGVTAPGSGIFGLGVGHAGYEGNGSGSGYEAVEEGMGDGLSKRWEEYEARKGAELRGASGGWGGAAVFGQPSAAPGGSTSAGLEVVLEDKNEDDDDEDEDEDENEDEDEDEDEDEGEGEGDYDDYDEEEEDAAAYLEVAAPMVDELME